MNRPTLLPRPCPSGVSRRLSPLSYRRFFGIFLFITSTVCQSQVCTRHSVKAFGTEEKNTSCLITQNHAQRRRSREVSFGVKYEEFFLHRGPKKPNDSSDSEGMHEKATGKVCSDFCTPTA